MSKKPKSLKCCVCGSSAGAFLQHWNRDTGWGVCRSCVDWEISRGIKPEELLKARLAYAQGIEREPR